LLGRDDTVEGIQALSTVENTSLLEGYAQADQVNIIIYRTALKTSPKAQRKTC
jgi:hypothetical protein